MVIPTGKPEGGKARPRSSIHPRHGPQRLAGRGPPPSGPALPAPSGRRRDSTATMLCVRGWPTAEAAALLGPVDETSCVAGTFRREKLMIGAVRSWLLWKVLRGSRLWRHSAKNRMALDPIFDTSLSLHYRNLKTPEKESERSDRGPSPSSLPLPPASYSSEWNVLPLETLTQGLPLARSDTLSTWLPLPRV